MRCSKTVMKLIFYNFISFLYTTVNSFQIVPFSSTSVEALFPFFVAVLEGFWNRLLQLHFFLDVIDSNKMTFFQLFFWRKEKPQKKTDEQTLREQWVTVDYIEMGKTRILPITFISCSCCTVVNSSLFGTSAYIYTTSYIGKSGISAIYAVV